MTKNNFFAKRIRSFACAFNGLKIIFFEETNLRIHFLAAITAIATSAYFRISLTEWIAVILCIGLVISTEIINSSIERISDFVSPQKNEKIKIIKDISAAAVLFSAISALAVGLIIFIPKIF